MTTGRINQLATTFDRRCFSRAVPLRHGGKVYTDATGRRPFPCGPAVFTCGFARLRFSLRRLVWPALALGATPDARTQPFTESCTRLRRGLHSVSPSPGRETFPEAG